MRPVPPRPIPRLAHGAHRGDARNRPARPEYLRERERLRTALTDMCGPVEDIARRAIRWSAEAGYRAEAEPVVRALSATGGFVEEVFDELCKALGIPAARQDPARPG